MVRFLYLGLPLGALCLAARGHRPLVVGSWHLDAPGHRRLRRRLAPAGTLLLGRPDLDDPATVALLAATRPEALLSWYWPRRIPEAVLALAPRGAFGVHPSLLPRWRGPDPTFHAIRAGDGETGATLHRLDAGYDTGPIVAQRRLRIRPEWTSWDLERALDRPSLALLTEAADQLAAGERLPGRPQGAAQVSWAPQPEPEELAIDWRRPAAEVLRLIRAAAPEPGATALLGETLVVVAAASRHRGPAPVGLRPGEAFITDRADGGRALVVATGGGEDGGGGVVLDAVRPVAPPERDEPRGPATREAAGTPLLRGSEVAALLERVE